MKKGIKVVCVNDTFEAWVKVLYTDLPEKGKEYTVRDVDVGVNVKSIESNPDSSILFKGNQTTTILLEELTNPVMPISKKEMGFGAWRFIPLNKEDVEAKAEFFQYIPDAVSKPVFTPKKKKKERELVPA